MAKKRIVAGYKLSPEGVIAPGEPIKGTVSIPEAATPLCVRIDPRGDFIIFAEVWSHPEGTTVNFQDFSITMVPTGVPLPAGSWDWWETLPVGPGIFHIYRKTDPQLRIAS